MLLGNGSSVSEHSKTSAHITEATLSCLEVMEQPELELKEHLITKTETSWVIFLPQVPQETALVIPDATAVSQWQAQRLGRKRYFPAE